MKTTKSKNKCLCGGKGYINGEANENHHPSIDCPYNLNMKKSSQGYKQKKVEYGDPLSTFIQWKGTDLCMDWFCEEGHQNHIDADFCYEVQCEVCNKLYEMGTMVELKPITKSRYE